MEFSDLGFVLVDQRLCPLPSGSGCLLNGRRSFDVIFFKLLLQILILDDEVVALLLQLIVLIVPMLLAQFVFIEGFGDFFEFILLTSESEFELSDLFQITTAHSSK